jgi:hypothetical protein
MEHFVVERGNRAHATVSVAAERLIRAFFVMCQRSSIIACMPRCTEAGCVGPAAGDRGDSRKRLD